MHKDWKNVADTMNGALKQMTTAIPNVAKAFGEIAKSSIGAGALDSKTKELIAVGTAIASRCDGCIAFHVRNAHKYGATREELAETVAVAIYMGGGPSYMYGALALEAYDQFAGQ